MSYCVKPRCENPQNQDSEQFCSSCGSKLSLRERYRPIKLLGRGGFGRTFLAVDEDIPSKPRACVKQFYFQDKDSEYYSKAVQLFRQEAIRLDHLGKHPQIPTLLAHFEQDQQLYLVQEFIEGKTLERELEESAFAEYQIWELLQNLLPVLQFIHDNRIIHRDIKPENIMRRYPGNQLVLIDFGIAKLLTDSAIQRTGTIIGTQEYAPPEQTKGKVVPASDIYSSGVTCIRLLTRAPIFDMYDPENDRWWWRDFLPKGTQVSERLAEILDKMIANKLRERYSSAQEVLQALALVSSPTPTQPLPSPSVAALFASAPLTSSPLASAPIPQPSLNSAVGADFTKLQTLLAANKWKEADIETWALMCQALGLSAGTHLEISDIDRLPCEDLLTIDRLWVSASQGRFGFSVQKAIYESANKDYIKFCQRVNWPSYNSTTFHQGLKFSPTAPAGHLPSRIWAGGAAWLRHAAAMAAKLQNCGAGSQS
ncbi:MAG: GUN4 domain-containing protein [Oscillatoria princeps RMCB-10]|jgi:serine/threonine protein kinase|nr:GUN4 domain-containing protein [Oscillatoria princeps RMCB-10]